MVGQTGDNAPDGKLSWRISTFWVNRVKLSVIVPDQEES